MPRGQKQMLGGCCVCLDESGSEENPLVYCDGAGCDVAVHKNCYGIIKVPSGPWYCQKCSSNERAENIRCCLCPKLQGVLKRTDDNRWAHILCALYISEVRFGDVTTMEPIIVSGIAPLTFNSKICYICEEMNSVDKQYGVCLTCYKPSCKVVFHVTCAQSRGLLTEEKGSAPGRVQYCGYCAVHSKSKPKLDDSSPVEHPENTVTFMDAVDHNTSSEEKNNLVTPLTVDTTQPAKPKARSRAKANNGGGPKPKRQRKPPAKKNTAGVLSKLSPQMKSPLRSPLRSPGMRSPPLRSPTMRSPTLLSPGRSTISLIPSTSAQGLLEQQFELGKKMLENQAPLDIAQLLTCISKIQEENQQLEAELQELTSRRDHLVSVNARLTFPTNNSVSKHNTLMNSTPTSASNGPVGHGGDMSFTSTSAPLSRPPPAQQTSAVSSQAPSPQTNSRAPANFSQSGAISQPARPPTHLTSQQQPTSASQVKKSASPALSRKRSAESVIKMNTKKQSTSPSVNKPNSRPPSQQRPGEQRPLEQRSSEVPSHFPWPQVSQPTASSYSQPDLSVSSYNQSVSSMLPPINALSQSRMPSQQIASSAASGYMNSASLANYTSSAGPGLVNYSHYSPFPMFASMAGGLGDMSSLNQTALSGLTMQGLHNAQQFYMNDNTGVNPNTNPGMQ